MHVARPAHTEAEFEGVIDVVRHRRPRLIALLSTSYRGPIKGGSQRVAGLHRVAKAQVHVIK